MFKNPEKIEELFIFWNELEMDFINLPENPEVDFSPFYAADKLSIKHVFFAMMIADIIAEINEHFTFKTYDCFSRELDLCFNEQEQEEFFKDKRKSIQKKIKKNIYFKEYSIGFKDFPAFFYEMDNINGFYRIFEIQNKDRIMKFDFSSDNVLYEDFREFFKDEIELFFKLFRNLNQYLILKILEKNKKEGNLSKTSPNKNFDRNQTILLMDRLKMIQAIEERPITIQAKIISEITGYNYDNIRKSLSSLNKKQSKLTSKQLSDKDQIDVFVDTLG